MTLKGCILLNDEAISPVLGTVLILAIGMTILTTVQVSFMPVWNAEEELNHLEKMNDDFKELKSSVESSAVSGTALSSPLSMGFKYSQKIIGYNPRERAYANFNIQKDTWAEVRYNEMFPEGMDDATSIKNITSGTITYSLLTPQNLSPFIYEHGLIRRGGSNYTAGAQSLIANGTLYLLSVNATEPESTTSAERRVINIYPTSPAKNSIIGKKVWLTLHTEYVDWWADDPNNPSNIQNLGGTIKKKDSVNGNIIAFFEGMEIRMGETQVTARSKKPPSRLPQYRLVKVSPQNVNLPVEGTQSLVLEVQDYYNNPVPNVPITLTVNSSRQPANAFSAAELLQSSVISGADGRANVQLKTSGAGLYYIDASAEGVSSATFVYPASSQGGFISLAYTGAETTYTITATLRNATGEPWGAGQTINFLSSNGTINPTGTTNASGNASTTLNTSTATDIRITNIQTANVTNSSAKITWDTNNSITVAANRTPGGYVFNSVDVPTNVNSNGCVRYGTSSGVYTSINCSTAPASSHSRSLTGLSPYTVYYFIVNSSRPAGASINSSEYMFVTESGAVETIPPASITSLNNVTYEPLYINWTWNDPADSDFKEVQVYIDGVYKTAVAKGVQAFDASYFRPNSTHNISTRTVDTNNNVNITWENRTASTQPMYTYVFDFLNTNGTVTGSSNAQNASDGGAFATLAEEATNISTQYNWSFPPPIVSNESWIFGYTVTTASSSLTVSAGNNTSDGVPPGSLFANISVTSNGVRTVITSWRSPNFTWNNGTPTSATLNFSFKVAQFTGSGGTNNYEVFLIDPNGIKKQINKTTTFSGATSWGNFSNSSINVMDFSTSGNYSLLLNATLSTTRIDVSNPGKVEVRWDNPNITLNYKTYGLNVTANTTGIPDATTQVLQLRYNVSVPGDNFTVQIWNGTNSTWNSKTTLNSSSLAYFNVTLESGELLSDGAFTGGSVGDLNKYYVRVRYTDVDASPTQQGRLYLDYQRVYST